VSYTLVSTILSTTATKSITVTAGQQLIIQAMDGATNTTTLSITDSQATPNTYERRGGQGDTREGFQGDWFDCLSPAAGTYNIELVGATGGQFVIRVVTGLGAFTGTFESANFTVTPPSTTDGVTTAAITPGSFPAVVMGAALTADGAGTLVIAAGTGFGNFFETTTTGFMQVAEDQVIESGSQIASFTAGPGQTDDVIVMGAAYTVAGGSTGAALAGAASDTTGATGVLTAPPAPFAPLPLNSGSNQINLGTGANTGTGDPLLTAFEKIAQDYANLNSMMSQIYLNRSTQTPVTGFSITPAQGVTLLVLNPAGTLATGTINMPVNPADNQPFTVMTSQTIAAITFTPAAGQTLNGAPATLTNTAAVKWIYQAALSAWFREQ